MECLIGAVVFFGILYGLDMLDSLSDWLRRKADGK